METLENSETLIEGLVAPKVDDSGNLFGGTFSGVSQSFDLGKVKCVESALAPVAESHCIDSCKVKGIDSSSHGDVPIKGISLFVELTGGVANKPDGESIRDVGNSLLYENQVKVDVGQQESEFKVGDIVWAIIKKQVKQSWWPGVVCDAANAPKETANEPTREDDILVRCFGNGNFFWCSSYEVKPFVGYFDQLPNQSSAKKFLDALEIALTELAHRVQTEFTCSCSSKVKAEKTGNIGDLSVARFEPTVFLDYIKDLGKSNLMPHKIDYAVKQNCLYAFYRSLGHLQIPMNQLKPANGTPLKIKNEEENGYFDDVTETRERRKSMCLSYPGEYGIEGSNVDVNGVDLNIVNGQSQPVKKPRKKWTRKNKVVQVNLCSSEVLSQLQFAAKDCLSQCESTNFDSVQRFISGFRKWAFNDFSSEIPIEGLNHQIMQETLPKKVRKKDKSVISPAVGNNLINGQRILDFQNVGSFNLEAQSMANKRTEWPVNQAPIFNFGYLPPTQPSLCKIEPKRPKNVAEGVTYMQTWNANISTPPIVNHMGVLYQAPVFKFPNAFGSIPPYFTGNYGEPPVGPVPTGLIRVPKKRGRKRKNIDLQANPGPTTNLSGNPASTTNLLGNPASTTNLLGNPGSTTDLQAKAGSTIGLRANPGSTIPGSTIGLQAHPGSTIGLQAHPGSTIGLQAHPGSTIGLQVHPGPTIGLQAHPGSTIGLQAHPGSTIGLQAHPGSTIGLQAHPGSSIGLQLHPASTIGLQPHPASTIGLQPHPGSTIGLQAPGSTISLQANLGSTIGFLANPGSTIYLQGNPGSTLDLQANPGSIIIPNLNEDIIGQKKHRRVKKSKEVGVPCIDLSYTKVQQDNVEVKGTAFLLKFSSDYPLPSNQDLNSAFSKFGELIESETLVSTENLSGQVVFLDSSSAGGAFWGLQNEKPFGPALVNYKIQHLAGSESMVPFKTPIKSPSGHKPMDSKAIINPTMIPDLNTNSTEVRILKRSNTIEEIRLPSKEIQPPSNDNYLSYSKVHQGSEEVTGTALLLKFSPHHPLPSSQDLQLVFCKYGELNESETQVSAQSFTGQVVFVNPSTAGDAILRLETDRPFGPALLSYRVHHLYNVHSVVRIKHPVKVPLEVKPPQDLGALKRNLEMMNLMLEKSGDSLSPEMRGKLESEIKGLMNKVSAMGGSSSSSCL